jgi:AcrR family transcriptional regulator
MVKHRDPALRGRLLESATTVFAEQGFAGASMEDIGTGAGVSKGGVYFHFRHKEELFFAVLDHWREELRKQLGEADAKEGSAEALRRFLSSFMGFHFRHPHASGLLAVMAAELRSGFTAQLREDPRQEQVWLRGQIRDLLTRGVQDGSLFTADPALAAFVLAGTVAGIRDQWLISQRDVEHFCHAEHLAEALVAGYATGAGASPRRRTPPPAAGADVDFQPPF